LWSRQLKRIKEPENPRSENLRESGSLSSKEKGIFEFNKHDYTSEVVIGLKE
jgi:hypothetical protein